MVNQEVEQDDIIPVAEQSLQQKARFRAVIRRSIPSRKSVQEGRPDRLADLLDEMADYIDLLEYTIESQ